ncbi:amidohydrolase family protein [Arcanobacterium haemolyticum]|nr:amidohydrolase family protein [Arcanobacterium haemolyticum]
MALHLTGTLRGTDLTEAWVVDGKIRHTAPAVVCEEVSGWIYPGLVDAHAHPGVSHTPDLTSDDEVVRRLDIMRSQGVTTCREMGAQRDVSALAQPGRTKVIRSGQHIARVKRYIRYMPVEVEPSQLAYEAARQARRSDGWIKIVGDWIDRSEGEGADLRPLWPRTNLIEAVRAAHDEGARVALHTFATETIDDALTAGVDSIEHGTGMTFDHMKEAARRGVLVDPTVRQISTFPDIAAQATKYPVYRQHMLSMDARRREHLAMLVEAGTHFIMGSDTAEDVAERGLPVELDMAVILGMPAALAMAAASYRGRALLGLPTWEDGAPADLVVYAGDPEKDIAEVHRPAAVYIDGIRGL